MLSPGVVVVQRKGILIFYTVGIAQLVTNSTYFWCTLHKEIAQFFSEYLYIYREREMTVRWVWGGWLQAICVGCQSLPVSLSLLLPSATCTVAVNNNNKQ